MTQTVAHEAVRSRLGDRLLVTMRARAALRKHVRATGPQHLVVTWPAGVTSVPAPVHEPGPHEVIVGHVARCPIYADLRQLALFRQRRQVLDLPLPPRAPRRPVFRLVDRSAFAG